MVTTAMRVPCFIRNSGADTIRHFQNRLRQRGLVATTRKTRGDDIDAACGQLAGRVSDRVQKRLGDKSISRGTGRDSNRLNRATA